MPRYILTDAEIRAAKPGVNGTVGKPMHGGGGLYLITTSATAKSWVLRYQLDHKKQSMGLGGYPDMTLKRARELCDGFRSQKAERVDPLAARGKATAVGRKKLRTPKDIGDAYFAVKKDSLEGEREAGSWWSPLVTPIMPTLGEKTLAQIGIDEIVAHFEPIWRTSIPR